LQLKSDAVVILTFTLVFTIISIAAALLFSYESFREQEARALKVGLFGTFVLLMLGVAVVLLPAIRIPYFIAASIAVFTGLIFALPIKSKARSLQGAMGYVEGKITRFNLLDTVFSRHSLLKPGTDTYKAYYQKYPDREEKDAKRRNKGGILGQMGAIDDQHKVNVELILTSHDLIGTLTPHSSGAQVAESAESNLRSEKKNDSPEKQEIDPQRAAEILKGFAKRLGACLVGICEVNQNWAYSHNGEGNEGQETSEPLPFAVVFATEMRYEDVGTSPHTTAEVECSINYAEGAVISTSLVSWIKGMGYKAKAQHAGGYEFPMPPLGIDAGLGELGRFGYVITDKYGPRVRIFACTTDMPLELDEPQDMGAEAFCERCKKCATACPSRSIPEGDQIVVNGIKRWKLDDESCFDYWGRVGTGCSVCMAICPFSRPNRSVHKVVRWFLKRSNLAAMVFPHIDNLVYGTKWRSKRPKEAWNSYLVSNNKTIQLN
jgi:ferredoxin